jgi:hypothetical protein
MWNVEAATAMAGGRATTADADALGGDDDRRRVSMEMESIAFLGRHFGPIANPGDAGAGPGSTPRLRTASMRVVRSPLDVNGLGWLTRRPIDGSAPERTWMYVPALRRVRALQPVQRADGIAGLAVSLDDQGCFDGRLESFTWKVIGQQDVLAPIVAAAPLAQRELTATRARIDLPAMPAAFEKPGTPGAPWGLVDDLQLTPRPAWVVEATPRDPEYPVGRLVLYVDRELYRPYWKLIYDRSGKLASHALCGQYWSRSEDGEFTAPATGLVAMADESGRAVLTRQRSEVLDQSLSGDWFSVTTLTAR